MFKKRLIFFRKIVLNMDLNERCKLVVERLPSKQDVADLNPRQSHTKIVKSVLMACLLGAQSLRLVWRIGVSIK